MSAPNTTKWIGTGLLGLPLYGVLTFWQASIPSPTRTRTTRPGLATSAPTTKC
jgi:hypothetical protein